MKNRILLAFLSTFLVCSAASAYVVKLKDGSLIFAKMKYTVKGDRAIITLENGTVTAMKLDQIDVEGSDKYNAENFGNVVAIDTPDGRKPTAVAPAGAASPRLQDYIKEKHPRMGLPAPGEKTADGSGPSFQPVDANLQTAFTKIFDGAGITQYRLTNFRGKTGLLVTTNTEEQVFNALSAPISAVFRVKLAGSLDRPTWSFVYSPLTLFKAGDVKAAAPEKPAEPSPLLNPPP